MNRAKALAELAARELSIDADGVLDGAPALAVVIHVMEWQPGSHTWLAARAGGFMIEPDKVAADAGYGAPSSAALAARVLAAYPELATAPNPMHWR